MANGRRKLLHRRAAEGIATQFAEQLPAVAGQLAHHYGEAGMRLEAAPFAEMAGEEALRLGAVAEAVAFYQQAHTLAPIGAGPRLDVSPRQIDGGAYGHLSYD